MAVYSISDLEKLSGVKAHTLRIWEQRYGIIEPKRTDTNIRYYEDDDLKFILNVALLNRNGVKISKIAQMSRQDIADKVAAISGGAHSQGEDQLDALTIAMIEMDEYKFDRIVVASINQIGFERSMLEVIYPFLEKLSILWLTGSISPVQENFISYLIRQKLIVAMDKEPLPLPGQYAPKFVVYLPQGERQELSILFMSYLLKARGMQVLYLGQDITISDLKDVYHIQRPDYIFTMITETFARESVQQYVDRLSNGFPDVQILLSGYQVVAQEVFPTANVTILKSLDQTIAFLSRLEAGAPKEVRQTAPASREYS